MASVIDDIDFYELLGVSRDADQNAIRAAYRRKAMECHPDRHGGCSEQEARFKAVNEAYDCLKDPQKRAAYDRYGRAAFQNGGAGPQPGFGDFADVFESFFGDAFGGTGRGRPAQGADLRYDLEITLEDAFHGKTHELTLEVATRCDACEGSGAASESTVHRCVMCQGAGKVRAQQGFFVVERTCPNCHGRGEVIDKPCRTCRGEGRVDQQRTLTVDIPPGVDEGTRIRLAGRGEAGPHGTPPGDLYIFIHVSRHPLFTREGTNLFAEVPVSFTTAALGGTVELPGLDGSVHSIRIPEGVQSGKQLRKRGAGMPVLQGRGAGDLIIQIAVETPTRLSARQRELLHQFRETETGEECPRASGFFGRIRDALGG